MYWCHLCKQLYSIAAVVTTRGHKGRGDAMLESESDSEPAKRPKPVADVKQVVRSTAAGSGGINSGGFLPRMQRVAALTDTASAKRVAALPVGSGGSQTQGGSFFSRRRGDDGKSIPAQPSPQLTPTPRPCSTGSTPPLRTSIPSANMSRKSQMRAAVAPNPLTTCPAQCLIGSFRGVEASVCFGTCCNVCLHIV